MPKLRQEIVSDEGWEEVGQSTVDTELFTENELAELTDWQLKRAMTQLPADEQWLLQMKYLNNFSIKEIASFFSITQSAVKMRLKRSRDRLRHIYIETSVQESLPFAIMYN